MSTELASEASGAISDDKTLARKAVCYRSVKQCEPLLECTGPLDIHDLY